MKLNLSICAFVLSGFLSLVKAVEGPVFLKRACAPAFNSDSSVTFYWDVPSDTCSSFTGFYLYGRESSANVFLVLDSIKNFNSTQHTYKLPNTKLTWQFYWAVRGSCGANDTFSSAIISIDKDPPTATLLDSVSVDLLTQETVMGWQPNLSPDLWGYTLYRRSDSTQGFTEILDLKGLSYLFTLTDPANDITYLSIASMDSCENLGAIAWQHRTIQLKHKIDTCKKEIYLSWTPYIGWKTDRYGVFADTNESGNYVLLATLSFNQFKYTYSYAAGKTHRFFIRSFKEASVFTSSSNVVSQATRKVKAPLFNYLSTVSVINNKHLLVRFYIDTDAEISYFYILRSKDSVNFKVIDSLPNSPLLQYREYTDTLVNVHSEKYFYKIDAYNACRNLFISSNVSHNILLKLDPSSTIYQLNWTDFTYWPSGIESFSVRRGSNAGSGYVWEQIFLTDGNGNSYLDNNSPIGSSGFAICYEILANENPGNPLGVKDSSISNQVCAVLDANVFFPNAFRPAGSNSTFLPIGLFINWDRSSIEIYNRWGELVWLSNGSIDYAWDGNDMNENPCQPGIYYFKAKIIGYRGNVINKTGTINLIR